MDYIWRTGFFADTAQAIKEEVRDNGPSLIGVGVAAGTGGVVGAYLHGLWHDRNRVIAVPPYLWWGVPLMYVDHYIAPHVFPHSMPDRKELLVPLLLDTPLLACPAIVPPSHLSINAFFSQ